MKLYYAPQTRAGRPRWMLEELGVPYELVTLDLGKGEHKTPAYRAIHPHGAVPALVDGDLTLFESAAICAYLADKYPEKHLAPPIGTPARGLYYQWMHYAMATIEPPLLQVFLHRVMLPEAERSPAVAEAGVQAFGEVVPVLERALAGRRWILGDQFSAADVMVGSCLIWGKFMGLTAAHPELEAYIGRLMERPAYRASAG